MCGSPEKQKPRQRWRADRGNRVVRGDGISNDGTGSKCKPGLPGASGRYLLLAERYQGPFLGWWGGLVL